MFLKEGGGSAAPFLQKVLPSPGADPTGKRVVRAGGGEGVGVNSFVAVFPCMIGNGTDHR
jgi:hypothetical protein